MVKAKKVMEGHKDRMRLWNIVVFVGGFTAFGIGVWQVSPSACWIALGIIAMGLVVLPEKWREPPK